MKFWKRLSPVGRALVFLAVVLIVMQAPEFAFLLDSVYIDFAVAIVASGLAGYFSYASGILASHAPAFQRHTKSLLISAITGGPRTLYVLISIVALAMLLPGFHAIIYGLGVPAYLLAAHLD